MAAQADDSDIELKLIAIVPNKEMANSFLIFKSLFNLFFLEISNIVYRLDSATNILKTSITLTNHYQYNNDSLYLYMENTPLKKGISVNY